MKIFVKSSFAVMLFSVAMLSGCSSGNTRNPQYQSEISLDEDEQVSDWGKSGQSTDDGDYYYNGSVTLYDEYGGSETFPCYIGRHGIESGCRGVIYEGVFYNLDRNKWVTIDGVKYKAFNIAD